MLFLCYLFCIYEVRRRVDVIIALALALRLAFIVFRSLIASAKASCRDWRHEAAHVNLQTVAVAVTRIVAAAEIGAETRTFLVYFVLRFRHTCQSVYQVPVHPSATDSGVALSAGPSCVSLFLCGTDWTAAFVSVWHLFFNHHDSFFYHPKKTGAT